MTPQRQRHFTLWNVGSQQLQVAFDGGCLVSDAGLLAVRTLEKPLRVIADLAQRLPDPRARKYIEHSAEAILTQAVYQILAGYPDFNDAQQLRDDPLFQILADVSPDADNPWQEQGDEEEVDSSAAACAAAQRELLKRVTRVNLD